MIIDTHSHIFDEAFDSDRAAAIERAQLVGVTKMVLPAIDSQSHARLLDCIAAYPDTCFGAMGLHPTSVNDNPLWGNELKIVEQMLAEKPVQWVAVGEIGIDLYWSKDFLKEQTAAFVRQIELALEYKLPVIIHTRAAWDEVFAAMRPYERVLTGVFHSFSGGEAQRDKILAMGGFAIGIGGVVTYPKSKFVRVLADCPLSKIVLETDAPYQPPVPHRGSRNESSYLPFVVDALAAIYGVEPSLVESTTTENADKLFRC